MLEWNHEWNHEWNSSVKAFFNTIQTKERMPVFDGSYFLSFASRLAHIGCAALLFGGLFYLRFIILPNEKTQTENDDLAGRLFGTKRKRWAMVVMLTAALLMASGLFNYMAIRKLHELPKLYHMLFGIKFMIALWAFFAASLISGRSDGAVKVRKGGNLWFNMAIFATFVVVVMGSFLRSLHQPKPIERTSEQATVVQPESEKLGET